MIENKRFIYAKSEGGTGYGIYDITKNYTFPTLPREYEAKVFCKILNKLYENNEMLKKDNYENIDGIAFYQEENASLCEKISDLECENKGLKHHLSKLQGQNEILNKENAMLKTTIARNEAYIERIQHKGVWRK